MTGVRAEDGDGGVGEFERILHSLSRDTPQSLRVQAYIALQNALNVVDCEKIISRICDDSQLLCRCIQRDMVSSSQDVASQTLRVLGALLHRTTFVTKIPDDEACKFLLTLLALITTSSNKVVCSLGLWCLAVQELKVSLLAQHLNMILAAILHGVDNPAGSMAITFEAFQALMHASIQLPVEMRNLSMLWVPPVCLKLLNNNTKVVELADKCLSETQAVLLPPLPRLSEVVAADMQQRLLPKIEAMMKLEGRPATTAVRAWAWLIKLLGVKSSDKSVINVMLQLLERSFVSPSIQVRSASQVAWVSLIDAFVHPSGDDGVDDSPEPLPAVPLSQKRLLLLLTPLKATMTWEKDMSVQRNCCRTWIYLLCKLGQSVNDKVIFDTAVVPILELVFTLGPSKRDESVWQAFVDILNYMISCKESRNTSVGSETLQFEGENLSPRTPNGIRYTGVFCGSHHKNIQWSPWRLDRLESILKIVRLLWTFGVDEQQSDTDPKSSASRSLKAARDCWRLLVQGVEMEERDAVRPSSKHVAAVHLLLEFFSGLCKGFPSQLLLSATWDMADVLIQVLPPVVMASSFYKKRLLLPGDSVESTRDYVNEGDFPTPEMVTPIVYMSAAWFKLVFQSSAHGEEMWLQPVETLVTSGRSGLDVMGSFHGFAWIVDHLGKGADIHVEESPSTKMALTVTAPQRRSTTNNWRFLVALWRNVAQQLKDFVEKLNDVLPVGNSHRDSGYQVVSGVLLFPIKHFLMLSLKQSRDPDKELSCDKRRFGILESELKSVESPWLELHLAASRVSTLKSTHFNSFSGAFFSKVLRVMKFYFPEEAHQAPRKPEDRRFGGAKLSDLCLRFLGGTVAHVLKQTEILNPAMLAISRKRRKTGYGASSVRVQCAAGMELADANNLKDLLTVTSRILILSYEKYKVENGDFFRYEVVFSVLRSVASLAQHISSQNDAVLLLQALVHPMRCWFTVGSESSEFGTQVDGQRHLPGSLMDGLTKAWDGLLLCLQTCRPCLVFDSDLLLVQSPSLAPAFLHHNGTISTRTLAFWEGTYGTKAVYLKYPPALVDVFNKLKQKVSMSLPGWNAAAQAAKPKLPGTASNSNRQPVSKIMRLSELRIQSMINSVDNKRAVRKEQHLSCSGAFREGFKPILGTTKRLNVREPGLQLGTTTAEVNKLGTGKCHDAQDTPSGLGFSDAKPGLSNGFLSTPEGNAIIDALMTTGTDSPAPDESTPSDHATNTPHVDVRLDPAKETSVAINSNTSIELPSPTKVEHSFSTEVPVDDGARGLEWVAEEERERAEAGAHASVSGTCQLKDTPSLVTPPVALNDSPSAPPMKPVVADQERNEDTGVLQVAAATCRTTRHGGKGRQAGTKFPKRRKKLKFQDDGQDAEYVPPQGSKKRAAPHPDRQKEGRSSQRAGRVVKSCTYVEISQSEGDDSADSQAVEAALDLACKENLSSNLQRLKAARNGADATGNDPIDNIESIEQNPTESDRNVGMERGYLSQADYLQLKCRLTSLWEEDPTLTYQQAYVQEKYESLPRLIKKRLHSHLYLLLKEAKANETDDAVQSTEVKVEDAALEPKSPRLRANADPGESSDGVEENSEEHVPCTLPLRRKAADFHGHCQRSVSLPHVSLRSGGKLRGGKNWRINSEVGRACTLITARLGNKKIAAKRQGVYRSLAAKIKEKIPAVATADSRNQPNCLPRPRGRPRKNFKQVLSGPAEPLAVPVGRSQDISAMVVEAAEPTRDVEQSALQENSPFRVRKLNRGLLATAYGLPRVADVESDDKTRTQKYFTQECIRTNHNPRKGKLPKRTPDGSSCGLLNPSLRLSTRAAGETSTAQEAVDLANGSPVQVTLSTDPSRTDLNASRSDGNSAPLLVCMLTEGLESQPSAVSRENQDRRCFFSKFMDSNAFGAAVPEEGKTQDNLEDTEDYPTPAVMHPVGLEESAANGQHTARHSQSGDVAPGSASRSGKDVTTEVRGMLERKEVKLSQVLTAILASSNCEDLDLAEVAKAESILSQLRHGLERRANNLKSSMFVTPPTHA